VVIFISDKARCWCFSTQLALVDNLVTDNINMSPLQLPISRYGVCFNFTMESLVSI
jgi:hypothetical protein